MSADDELERLKARRLAEMRHNISSRDEPGPETPQTSPRDILVGYLGYRGEEVLRNAEYQYPDRTRTVVQKLAGLILSGDIRDTIDGGQLLAVFRSVGMLVRMDTKIQVEKDGKFVSLSDKLGMD